MKSSAKHILFPIVMFVASCSSGPEKSAENDTAEADAKDGACTYTYVNDSTEVKWTAFKTTEKIGVSGVFDVLEVSGAVPSDKMVDVFGSASFNIPISGLNTTVPDRDKKIMDHFFGTMLKTDALGGKVVSMSGDKAAVAVSMNNITDTVDFDVVLEGERVLLTTVVDVAAWNASASIDSLNQVCYDLHTGADGVSKLWPEVKLEIRTVLAKECN